MNTPCLKLFKLGMRPSGKGDGTCMSHWANRLVDQYADTGAVSVSWEGPDREVHICKRLFAKQPHAFEHIMQFARMWDLDYEKDSEQCGRCQGHPACLAKT